MEIRLSSGLEKNLWHASTDEIQLFGIPIDRVTQPEAVGRVQDWIQSGASGKLIFTPDTTALMRARHDQTLMKAYEAADLVTADGTGLLLASKLFGSALPERVTGIDLVEALCACAARSSHNIYFLGAKPGVANAASQNLAKRHTGLRVAGTYHGYFDETEESKLIDQINQKQPDLLFVGMGVPRQENWIMKNRSRLNAKVIMGVGGSFDVMAGVVDRAPQQWQSAGLEWLWRTIREPYRIERVRVIPLFLLEIYAYKIMTSLFGPIS